MVQLVIQTGLILGIAALIGLNAKQRYFRPISFWSDRLQALADPTAAAPHVNIAKLFWDNRDTVRALTELRIADIISKHHVGLNIDSSATSVSDVLGTSSSPLDLLSIWREEPQKAAERFDYWKKVTERYPDYRDAYILAGIMALQQGKRDVATEYFDRAAALDPNNSLVLRLQQMTHPADSTN